MDPARSGCVPFFICFFLFVFFFFLLFLFLIFHCQQPARHCPTGTSLEGGRIVARDHAFRALSLPNLHCARECFWLASRGHRAPITLEPRTSCQNPCPRFGHIPNSGQEFYRHSSTFCSSTFSVYGLVSQSPQKQLHMHRHPHIGAQSHAHTHAWPSRCYRFRPHVDLKSGLAQGPVNSVALRCASF
ncbi:hypothetical protein TBLA_0B01420 [Henningerozyma blattae CBS 6284]|uniref:Uncharacterized protein n=1 Tax=Henningerozyma blattae (strain ATCC 34711 / CBS 6284 / DSM 70876 / NBRC 10599 / NRRL Y-10934 / UCD 77-7) TaxID=1071380 RepID=I2GXY3_HENB6|nr:hypothetical protein TBLA_0B01420 [Tetrapisispora blattae CBS 6284]CCH58985.1 hypothetical protein TBLA_0B01420 [Tetrapisispora blattae CBS 6284]